MKTASEMLKKAELDSIESAHNDTIQNNLPAEEFENNLSSWRKIHYASAMQQYAEQQAIGFMVFTTENGYERGTNGIWLCDGFGTFTDEQIYRAYQLFLTSQKENDGTKGN